MITINIIQIYKQYDIRLIKLYEQLIKLNSENKMRQMPLKIYYLKDQMKLQKPQKQQKLSVTYLSSFLQNDRDPAKYQQQKIGTYIQHKYNQQNLNNQYKFKTPDHLSSAQQKIVNNATGLPSMYDTWNRVKSKNNQEDQRMLTNIVGKNWCTIDKAKGQKKWKKLSTKIKTMKTISKQIPNQYEQNTIKSNNKRMLGEHFQLFLNSHQKKQKSNRTESNKSSQENYYVNKIDQHKFGKTGISQSFTDQPSTDRNFKHKITPLDHSLDILQSQPKRQSRIRAQTINPRVIFSSQGVRSGFKYIPNFKWSKLNRQNKFKLDF